MTTIRVARRARFTTVDREAVNDERLSFRARGILIWLLDKPDDWRCNSDEIAAQSTEGRDAVRTALRELMALDYIRRTREQDAGGHWHTVTVVFEQPMTDDGFPVVGSPGVGEPVVGEPGPLLKTENEDCERSKTPPTPQGSELVLIPDFEIFWKHYPRKIDKRDAERAYAKARKKVDTDAPILIGLEAWCNYWAIKNEPQFIPHAARWLNAERWDCEPPLLPSQQPKLSSGAQALLRRRQAAS